VARAVLARGLDAEDLGDEILLLSALGIPHALVPDVEAERDGVLLVVDAPHEARARAELARLDHDRLPLAEPVALRGGVRAGLPAAIALLAGHLWLWLQPAPRRLVLYAAGELDAVRVRAGELGRAVTALTLHADPAHVLGNAVATAIFVTAAGDWLGPGLALLLTVLAGALGNLSAALIDVDHRAIGFSTSTFGALGLNVVFGFVARYRERFARRRAWLALGAGVALLALIGAGERSDLLAHALGLAWGVVLGAIVSRLAGPARRTGGVGPQLAYAVVALAVIALAWLRALGGRA
jgi:membrane associated rhomboid family serine protease